MTVKERILAIKLMEDIERHPELAKKIEVSAELMEKHRVKRPEEKKGS